MASTPYLAVLKAAYDYEPTSEDEIAIKEDQILFLIERTDDDWWRVKPKEADENDAGGLVPAAYVEQAPHKSTVKAAYDYDATAPGELSIKENDTLLAFEADEGWLLVQTEKDGGKAGFIPENYVEAIGDGESAAVAVEEPEPLVEEEEEEEEAPAAPAIVVPDSPPRPSAPYIDPAERVAASHSKVVVVNDSIQTWAVSEVDKKGKKKKGTLGVGNGSIFFASDSDKNPVQKWSTGDIDASYTEKGKHVHVEILGPNPINLHFSAGSKDTAEAIIEKLDSSKAAVKAAIASASAPTTPLAEEPNGSALRSVSASPKPKKNGVSVHFATTPPSIISPREQDAESEAEDYISARDDRPKGDGNAWATVLYDFTADGDDELSVQEGDRLIVLERDSDDWWKVRDSLGHEGVVPASYVELEESKGGASNGNTAAREAAERDEASKATERKRAEQERKAKLAAEADVERRRREREREQEEEEERRRSEEHERKDVARRKAEKTRQQDASQSSRQSSDKPRSTPAPNRVRTWHDRTGQFKVDAEFLGYSNGKLRLHKTNGVVIEVPAEKMSTEDMKFIEWMQSKEKEPSRTKSPVAESDDEPLAVRRRSLQPEPKARRPVPPKKGKPMDWFEFFLNAGCGLDECTRYAEAFERDKIDEALLPDITTETMRTIGLKEGDIIRVSKAIAQRHPNQQTTAEGQLKKDEEYARKLQEEENGGRNSPKRQTASPGLFAGPGGTLKNNTRRGRPQSSKSTVPGSVDLVSLSTASESIRQGSPSIPRVSSPLSAGSNLTRASGFDDDAWTNRPSSTQPTATASTSTAAARAPSAPPTTAQSPPAPPAAPPAPTPPAVATSPTKNLASTTESDVFEQLARLSALKTQSPATQSPAPAVASPASPPVVSLPPGFQNGMGMGPSPVPMGQIQPQPTGVQLGTPRGPFAPVPQNQGLLQPLVPTNTGFNSFVPTRPQSNPPPPVPSLSSPFGNPSPQPSFLNTQPTGFQAPQATGFPGSIGAPQPQSAYPSSINSQPTGFGGIGGIQPQQTGFPVQGPLMAQTTSFPGAFGSGPFTGGRAFGALQPNVTGFNPNQGFGQVSSPPPVPPLPQSNNNSTAPANVFAQMKSGTFGNDSAPQDSNKYNALRPQPTGWGQQQGFQNGYSGPFY